MTDEIQTRMLPDTGLLPCPFCGGEADYYVADQAVFTVSWVGHVCHCKNCQSRVQTVGGKDIAIAMWNGRTPGPAQGPVPKGMKPVYVKRWRTLILVGEDIADEVRDALRDPVSSTDRATADPIREALDLAVNIIMANEPPDSRAVSNEAVALAAVACGDTSDEVMAVIRSAPRAKQTEVTWSDDDEIEEAQRICDRRRKKNPGDCPGNIQECDCIDDARDVLARRAPAPLQDRVGENS